MEYEKNIIESWKVNANNWIDIIDRNGVESRKAATNQAMIDTILSVQPGSVLDVGCGEGWLSKVLSNRQIKVTGFDAVPALIERTKQQADGEFIVATYEDIFLKKIILPSNYNVIAANFSLIGDESTENLIPVLKEYLFPGGALVIQTLHPFARKATNDYTTGWKEGSWDGFENFTLPYSWYFRTMEDLIDLLHNSGFEEVSIKDVLHPVSGKLLSIIFTCRQS